MLHRIDASYHQASFARSSCAWLTIDDIAIEQWLSVHLKQPDVAKLGLSLIWLLDEDEGELAKRRFIPGDEGTSTIVPLLVCSDDMDFDCIAVVAEQIVEGDTVRWARFGWSVSGGLEVGVSTRWDASSQPVCFDLSNFNAALEKFDGLVKEHTARS